MADNFRFAQLQPFTLAGAGAIIGDTTIVLKSMTEIDGTAVVFATVFGDIGYATIQPGEGTSEEQISFTGITQNSNGTATLTGVKSVTFTYPYTETSGLLKTHPGSTSLIVSNTSGFYNKLTSKDSDETINGLWTFTQLPESTGGNATSGTQLITYAQALALATGTAAIDRTVVAGNGGETITAGQLVYLNVTDGEWYKCDADTAGTVNNIILGIAQGAGSDGVAITNGVLIFGLDSNQTGLTNNSTYYASNTAGGISLTAGTTEVTVGVSRSTTSILFFPRYNQVLTEDQQDALAGNNGNPSNTNKFVTQTGLQTASEVFAASSSGNDTYSITLSPAPTAYVQGMTFKFKADVANTGTATLNVNGLGAIDLKTIQGNTLTTNEITANQIVEVVYNSTGPSFRILSQSALASIEVVDFNYISNSAPKALTSYTQQLNIPTTAINGWTLNNTPTITSYPNGILSSKTSSSAGVKVAQLMGIASGTTALQYSSGIDISMSYFFTPELTSNSGTGIAYTHGFGEANFTTITTTGYRLCFIHYGGRIYALSDNNASVTTVDIMADPGAVKKRYTIQYNGSAGLFYIDGVLSATISTTMPSGNVGFQFCSDRTTGSNSFNLSHITYSETLA